MPRYNSYNTKTGLINEDCVNLYKNSSRFNNEKKINIKIHPNSKLNVNVNVDSNDLVTILIN